MINEAGQGLEDVLHQNYVMRGTQEREEYFQRQEEAWREGEGISKAQEEAEERKKQAEMDACMNKEQQVPEYQQSTNPQCNTQRNKNVSIQHDNILKLRLITCPLRHQVTRSKHCWMTHMMQVQGKNQTST